MSAPDEDLAYRPISELSALIREGAISPSEVTEAALARIERLNPKLNAYYCVFAAEARAEAAQATQEIRAGRWRGPLHGVPVAVKDICEAGPTTGGSKLRAAYVAAEDATVVAKLRQAGAVMLGKLATHEFALGTPTRASHFPPALNPWNLELGPGGSSSGSGVAAAAGLAYATIGTDTGGSIRFPAFATGVVGLKATYGRVSRAGVFPLSWNQDHVGPLTRSVADAAVMLQAIAGADPRDPTTLDEPPPDFTTRLGRDIQGVRVGVPWDLFASSCQPQVLDNFKAALAALEGLGARVVEVPFVSQKVVSAIQLPLMVADAVTYHFKDFRERPEVFGPYFRTMVSAGLAINAAHYMNCQRARDVIRRRMTVAFETIDVLATPTCGALTTPVLDAPGDLAYVIGDDFHVYTPVFNLTGFPAISVPSGFSREGMPLALQIAAPPLAEPFLLQVAHAYEQAHAWRHERPRGLLEPA